jgi:hypothetical protein
MESDCIIMSLIYVERLLKQTKGGIRLTYKNWQSIIFSSMVMASKVRAGRAPRTPPLSLTRLFAPRCGTTCPCGTRTSRRSAPPSPCSGSTSSNWRTWTR